MKPSDFFKSSLGRMVNVRLNDGQMATGVLICLDGSLNMVLQQTKFNQLQGQRVLIRGNCVSWIEDLNRNSLLTEFPQISEFFDNLQQFNIMKDGKLPFLVLSTPINQSPLQQTIFSTFSNTLFRSFSCKSVSGAIIVLTLLLYIIMLSIGGVYSKSLSIPLPIDPQTLENFQAVSYNYIKQFQFQRILIAPLLDSNLFSIFINIYYFAFIGAQLQFFVGKLQYGIIIIVASAMGLLSSCVIQKKILNFGSFYYNYAIMGSSIIYIALNWQNLAVHGQLRANIVILLIFITLFMIINSLSSQSMPGMVISMISAMVITYVLLQKRTARRLGGACCLLLGLVTVLLLVFL